MSVVVGIDSGGTNTRSLAVTLDGSVVGYGESGGGHPHHASAYRYRIVKPQLPPVVGAVLMALEREGVRLGSEGKAALAQFYAVQMGG